MADDIRVRNNARKGSKRVADVVRVNTRISRTLNEWLNKRSIKTGLSKSTLIMLALENYYQQTEVVDQMIKWEAIYKEVNDLKRWKEKMDT